MKLCNEHLALHSHIPGDKVERISTSSVNTFLLKIDKQSDHILLPKVIDVLKKGPDATGIGTFTWNHSLT